MNRSRLLTSTLNTTTLRLIGQIIALVTGVVISAQFGANTATDSYYTALILPGSLANILVTALMVAFIPLYLEHINHAPQEQSALLRSLYFIALLSFIPAGVVSLIGVGFSLASRQLTAPTDTQQAVHFGLAFLALIPLLGGARIAAFICEAHQHYSASVLAVLANYGVFLVLLVMTVNALGIYSLLWANLGGAGAELTYIWGYSRAKLNLPLLFTPRIHPVVWKAVRNSPAPIIAYLAFFFVPVIDRTIATTLQTGSLTAFHYGERIVTAIDALIAGGVLIVLSNYWANIVASKGREAIIEGVNEGVALFAFGLIPLCIGAALLGRPIISVVFERGAFTAVEQSAAVFSVLVGCLFLSHYIGLFLRLFQMLRNSQAQILFSLLTIPLNLISDLVFVSICGLLGIALSTLLTRFIVTGALYALVRRELPGVSLRRILPRLSRTLFSTLVMGGIVIALQVLFAGLLARENGFALQVISLIVVIGCGIVTYFLVARLIKHPDLRTLLQVATRTRYRIFVKWINW